ncbi:leishmanolysin-like peptidase [Thrips palmi]|uniref:Leishmanolysin-like peptidase n=1 Tax=Thrips palmi TaxID=161013 RepID=A0A6P8ZAC1_THRPL|nr:leishmanolysin-like peptidase [Thrips palmi]
MAWAPRPAGLLLLALALLALAEAVQSHGQHCSHVHPKDDEVVRDVDLGEPHHVIRKRAADQPLRILLYYDQSVYRLEEEKFELINNTILPEAVRFWENALMVRRAGSTIRLNRKCANNQLFYRKDGVFCKNACDEKTMCGEVEVPEEHLEVCRTCNDTGQDCGELEGSSQGAGIDDIDFIFYVSAMQTERCNKGQTVAYAAHCQQEAALDRPIAGHANLCPDNIVTKRQEQEILLSTVKHEILHALGFSVSLYAFYRDQDGNPLTPREENGKPLLNEKLQARQWSDRVIKTVHRPKWVVRGGAVARDVLMMVTPRVVREARDHFGCPTLEGAELEDQGDEGTSLTHWEKRVFENEAMTGTHTQNPVYSRLTLALMEDTGWYRANYSMAQPLMWGKRLGCDFAMKSCKEWMDLKHKQGMPIAPFCSKVKQDPLETECTNDRSSVALCNLLEHSEQLPRMFQNFDEIYNVEKGREGFYGGSVSLADYCPYIQEFTWRSKSVVVRGSNCRYFENNPHKDKNFALESYGDDSKCFLQSNRRWEERSCTQLRQWQHWGSGCYEYHCADGRLHIHVENYTFTCYNEGQQVEIRLLSNGWLHNGVLICPRCSQLCKDKFDNPGEKCLPDSPVPDNVTYHEDELVCGQAGLRPPLWLLVLPIIISVFVHR